jgi:hypothetical protein
LKTVLFEADWEDMTGSTPLEVNKDVVHFTTKVSALFWILVIHDQQRSLISLLDAHCSAFTMRDRMPLVTDLSLL